MNLIIPLSDNIIIISQDFTNNKSPLFSTKHRIILLSFTDITTLRHQEWPSSRHRAVS